MYQYKFVFLNNQEQILCTNYQLVVIKNFPKFYLVKLFTYLLKKITYKYINDLLATKIPLKYYKEMDLHASLMHSYHNLEYLIGRQQFYHQLVPRLNIKYIKKNINIKFFVYNKKKIININLF